MDGSPRRAALDAHQPGIAHAHRRRCPAHGRSTSYYRPPSADSASAADRDHAGLSYVVVDESSSNGVNLHALIALHGLSGETLAGRAYTCTDPQAVLVPLHRISGGVLPLEASKLEAVLIAVAADVPLPPVHVTEAFTLTDGYHRFAVSQARGAATIPTQKVA